MVNSQGMKRKEDEKEKKGKVRKRRENRGFAVMTPGWRKLNVRKEKHHVCFSSQMLKYEIMTM